MVKEILVVKTDKLFINYFQGFKSINEKDYLPIILKNFEYQERNEALENNAGFKQLINYIFIINPKTKKIFAYKRDKKYSQDYKEMRLHNKISLGIGGHIDKEDSGDVIYDSMLRELEEEVVMEKYSRPKIVGFINDDSEMVGKVHFGVVSILETEQEVSSREGDEIKEAGFYSINEIEKLFSSPENEVEGWTRIMWPFVRDYINSL